jgi:hypothetical protein
MRTIRVLLIAVVIVGGAAIVVGGLWPVAGESLMTREISRSAGDENELSAELRRVRDLAEEALSEARRARDEARALKAELAEMRGKLATAGENSSIPIASQASQPPQSQPGARIERLEEQVEINTARIREHAQTKVESDSRFPVRISGMILANFHYNSDDLQRTQPLVAPSSLNRLAGGTFGSTFRQTRLGLAVNGPSFAGGKTSGEIELDFYGGTVGQVEGDVLGALRIRTAAMRVDWAQSTLTIGQETPAISPRNPTSIAGVWYAPLSGAGNLWQWRPQIRYEHRFRAGEAKEWIVQGSVLPPFGESYLGLPTRGTPALEARTAWRHQIDEDRTLEIGGGAHYDHRSFNFGHSVNGYIVSGDWLVPLGSRFELSGELYHGRGVTLGDQSGGRIDRAYSFSGSPEDAYTTVRAVRSSGGWIQLSTRLRSNLEMNLAYGQEDPDNTDLRFGVTTDSTRYKNQVGSINFIYELRPSFLISLEYRRLLTDYNSGRGRNNHVNLAFGYVF